MRSKRAKFFFVTYLVSPDHQLEPEPHQELGHAVGAELVRHLTPDVGAPAAHAGAASRVGPEQVTHDAAPRQHADRPPDPVDLVQASQVRAEAAVCAKYLAADYRGHGHAVERPVERLPRAPARTRTESGPAFVVKPVPRVHGPALVVAAQQMNGIRIPDLERQQQRDHLWHTVIVAVSSAVRKPFADRRDARDERAFTY